MSRFRDLRRDLAYYFGLGEGSHSGRGAEQDEASWLSTAVGVVPVLTVAFVLPRVLGLDDGIEFVATLGLVVVLAAAWGLVLRLVRKRRNAPPA